MKILRIDAVSIFGILEISFSEEEFASALWISQWPGDSSREKGRDCFTSVGGS
jgi:hypothetical protein